MKDVGSEWWHDAYSSALSGVRKKNKKKSKDKEGAAMNPDAPTYEELFAATGGARLGMRARASQKGKLLRTEQTESVRSVAGVEAEKNSDRVLDISSKEEVVDMEDVSTEKKRKKKRKTKADAEQDSDGNVLHLGMDSILDEESAIRSKKKRKREKSEGVDAE